MVATRPPLPDLTRPARIFSVVLALLVILVGAVLSFRHSGGVVFPDEKDYFELADNLVKYRMFTLDGTTPTASRPPGFVLWLAIWKALGFSWEAMVWLNSLVVVAAIWFLTGRWFSGPALWTGRAAVFALLFAYPLTLYVFSTLYPQAFCFSLMAFALALLLGRGGLGSAFLAGALMGWCVLSAPMYLTWIAILGVIPLFRRKLAGLLAALVFGGTCVLVVGAWGGRNLVTMGQFVPFSTNSGFNLLAGNCENTRPNAGLNIDLKPWMKAVEDRQLGEIEADAYYAGEARKWIAENPTKAASMYFQKFANYFNFRNELVMASAASPARDAVMFVTYYGLMALLLARLVFRGIAGPPQVKDYLLLVGYVACALFTSLVTTRIRYRVPCDIFAMLVIAPLVVAGVQIAAQRLRAFRSKSPEGA